MWIHILFFYDIIKISQKKKATGKTWLNRDYEIHQFEDILPAIYNIQKVYFSTLQNYTICI